MGSGKEVKISAVIITLNEERVIGRCLGSLQEVADEIIVIDSFSIDNTEKICQEYDVNFIKRKFIDYSDAKNYGNSLAKFPVILSIDADEALSEKLIESIREIKSNFRYDFYSLNRKTNYCGKWINYCGWYPDTKIRIWEKGKANWSGKIHEQLKLSGNNKGHLNGDLLHYSYPTIESHHLKMNLFVELAAKDMYDKGKKASFIKLIFSPTFKFFKQYFFERGFMDGFYGFVICIMSSYYVFNKYARLIELCKREKA